MSINHYATHQVVSINPHSTIDKAIGLMEEFNIHHLPVVDGHHVVGMLSDRDVLLAVGGKLAVERPAGRGVGVLGPEFVEQIMSQPVVTASPDDGVPHVAKIMIDRKINALPLVVRGHLVGIVTEADLLRETRHAGHPDSPSAKFFERPVSEFMKASVATVEPRATLIEIMEVIHRRHVRHVPVTIDRTLMGIISDRDVRRALGELILDDLKAERVGRLGDDDPTAMDIMTRDVRTVGLRVPLAEAVDQLLEHGIHCLPAVQDDKLVGIITHSDILRAVIAAEFL